MLSFHVGYIQLPRLHNVVLLYTNVCPVEWLSELPPGYLHIRHLFLHLNPTSPLCAISLIVHWKKEKENNMTCVYVVLSENLGNYLMN